MNEYKLAEVELIIDRWLEVSVECNSPKERERLCRDLLNTFKNEGFEILKGD